MDLQSILDASDSSDDAGEHDLPSSSSPAYRFTSATAAAAADQSSSAMDLEQILREEEDDEDDDDDDDHVDDDDDDDEDYDAPRNYRNAAARAWEGSRSTATDRSSLWDGTGDKFPAQNGREKSYATPSRNAEDWAVLQAILGEDDEDDDDDTHGVNGYTDAIPSAAKYTYKHTTRDTEDVNAILQSDDENDHGDVDFGDASTLSGTFPSTSSPVQHPLPPPNDFHGIQDMLPAVTGDAVAAEYANRTRSEKEKGLSPSRPKKIYTSSSVATSIESSLSSAPQRQRDDLDDKVSQRALQHAQNYERKLLKSGHREIVSPLMVKRRLRPKVDMVARHQQNKPAALADRLSTTSAPRFRFSGVVENKVMSDISTSLVKHASTEHAKVYCGLPTCVSFNSKFIAVGTQRGIILLYDLFEVLRQRLGGSGYEDNFSAKKAGSITSVDISHNGDVVIAGYTSGIIVLWDAIKGTVLRNINDSNPSPITSVRFLMDLKVVTVDAGGLVNKLSFSRNIIWSNYSMESECLLDGTAGQILAMNVLPPYSTVKTQLRPEKLSPVLRRLTLIALSSSRSSFAVAVEPVVNVLHRWAKPPNERTDVVDGSMDLPAGEAYLPCLSWGWGLVSGGGNVVMPILARAWGCCLQLLCASFPTVDGSDGTDKPGNMHWPAFGVHKEIDATTPVVALEWLNERSLVYLTVTSEFTLVDTVMMTLLERLDFSGLRMVYAEFSLSRSAAQDNGDDEDRKQSCTTFQNSIRYSDGRLIVLCQSEVKCISIVGARARISALEEDGEWLEALALALDHYESTVISQEDRKRDPEGKRDLSHHPEFSIMKSGDDEWIAKLLIRYLSLAVDNAPEPSKDHAGISPGRAASRIDLAQSHFQMLAGVCVEFCVVTRRLDLLFGSIFRRFQSVGYTSVFLDVLEPYVLNDKLAYIAPEVMSFFVEHCKATNGIATVERCLLHMDCTIMDFDTILSLLRSNEMYSAIFYVFNQGLDDYVTPLELLLEKVFDEADAGSASQSRRRDGVLQNDFERFGYKAILYLKTCFEGKTFPQENKLTPEERKNTLRPELLNLLMENGFSPSTQVKRKFGGTTVLGQRAQPYPYMRALLQVDPSRLLESIALAVNDPGTGEVVALMSEIAGGWENGSVSRPNSASRCPTIQEISNVLVSIILPNSTSSLNKQLPLFQARKAVHALLDFVAKFITNGVVRVDKAVTLRILTRMAERFTDANDVGSRQLAQRAVMDFLSALPRDAYDPDEVLALIAKSGIHRAALLLHQQVASSWQDESPKDLELRARHFRSAIDCFLGDDDEIFRKEVFAYARKECSRASEGAGPSREGGPESLRGALFAKLRDLVHLDALMTTRLVAELFVDEIDDVVTVLDSGDGGEAQFLFLRAIVSGDLVQVDPVAGSVLNLTMEHHHKYLSLMAKLHPDSVYEYLSTHDSYRAEECLKLCQDYGIADASAYLLERMGNVSSALQLILQTLESRMMNLKRTIRGMGVDVFRRQATRHYLHGAGERSSTRLPSKQELEVEGAKRILGVALDLCQRNSGTFATPSEHGSQLWFNVLDRLINAKGFLRLSKEQPEHSKVMAGVLSELLRLTMQRMVSSVPLTDLVRKVTSDHSGSRLGELREMVESLLGTYGFERKVFRSAVRVFRQDLYGMQKDHRALRLEGSPILSIMNVPLRNEKSTGMVDFARLSTTRDAALKLTSGGNASLVSGGACSFSRGAESGLATALSRLRSRRGGRQMGTRQTSLSCAGGLNMMTVTDQMYEDGEIEPVVDGEREVGVLGDAEHRGRLMTFQY
jgi:hypothetical protein